MESVVLYVCQVDFVVLRRCIRRCIRNYTIFSGEIADDFPGRRCIFHHIHCVCVRALCNFECIAIHPSVNDVSQTHRYMYMHNIGDVPNARPVHAGNCCNLVKHGMECVH